jgi:hypothetical protein
MPVACGKVPAGRVAENGSRLDIKNPGAKADFEHLHRSNEPTKGTAVNELIFLVEDAPEGGYAARSLGQSVFTEAETLDELRANIRDAVACHFDDGTGPRIIRLHYVREEVLTP